MKRTFIAVKIPVEEKLSSMLDEYMNVLYGDKIKWVNPENYHITLFFLGDTEESLIKPVSLEIRDIVRKYKKFNITLSETGIFKNIHSPRILWIGINNYTTLSNIKNDIDTKLHFLGFEKDKKTFKPHLTFGRIKFIQKTSKLLELMEKYKDVVFQTTLINKVIYFESILKQDGPDYKILSEFELEV